MQRIVSASNETFRAFARLCRDKQARDSEGLCVLDGLKLAADAAGSGLPILQLWATEFCMEKHAEQMRPLAAAAERLFLLGDAAAKKASELKAPQGVFAVVRRPAPCSVAELAEQPRILGLCSLQNPENVGAAVRSAAALGFGGVLLSADCADLWSPRALRAGAGCQLRLSTAVAEDFTAAVRQLSAAGVCTLASALHRDALPISRVERRQRMFVAVGNEGNGLPQAVIDACDSAVVIPMSGAAESLNAAAAAAILLWELRRDG